MCITPNVCVYVLQMSDGKAEVHVADEAKEAEERAADEAKADCEQTAEDMVHNKIRRLLDQMKDAVDSDAGVSKNLIQEAQEANNNAAKRKKDLLASYRKLKAEPSEIIGAFAKATDTFVQAQEMITQGKDTHGPIVALTAQQTIMVASMMKQQNKQNPFYLQAVHAAVMETQHTRKFADKVAKHMDGTNAHLKRITELLEMSLLKDAMEKPRASPDTPSAAPTEASTICSMEDDAD